MARFLPNFALRHARGENGWSQAHVANLVGTNTFTVCRWERGLAFPSPYYRQKLAEAFGKNLGALGLIPQETSQQKLSIPPQNPPISTQTQNAEEEVSTFGNLLKVFRKRKQFTQQELAARIKVHRNTIGDWEHGRSLPESKTVVLDLARQLQLDTRGARLLLEASLTALSPYWYLPYRRNPFFTGREEVLELLHDGLRYELVAVRSQVYALNGLGGIGKTQIAIEYAYRYGNDYSAVFWINAETPESISTCLAAIARQLNLPARQETVQSLIMADVLHWLNHHSRWLLIFDNVEDPALVNNFLPASRRGCLFFASRRQALGLSTHTLELEPMTRDEGIHFLLLRAGLLSPTTSLQQIYPAQMKYAQAIVQNMGGLPLALDQAGAYIDATKCGLDTYLQHFRTSQLRLLDERAPQAEYPLSVTKTFLITFEKVLHINTLAAEILTVCAFLAPVAIPEVFFTQGALYLESTFVSLQNDPLLFDAALKELLAYSLIRRNASTHSVTVHCLVQTVLRESLSAADHLLWRTRVLHAMVQLFPTEKIQAPASLFYEQLLPHVLAYISWSNRWNDAFPLITPLLQKVDSYLSDHSGFTAAESL